MRIAREQSDLSDLRLRRTTDQLQLLLANVEKWHGVAIEDALGRSLAEGDRATAPLATKLGVAEVIAPSDGLQEAAARDLAVCNPGFLHQIVATYIDGFSAWETVSPFALAVAEVIDLVPASQDGGHLLNALASVIAVDTGCDYEPLFEGALERLDDLWDRFFVLLRYATAALKRSRDVDLFLAICERAEGTIRDLRSARVDDGEFSDCLLNNLRALDLFQKREFELAEESCTRTRMRSTVCIPSLREDLVARYRATFRVNEAVVRAQTSGPTEAANLLKRALALCDPWDVGSRAEALGLQALFLLRAGEPTTATTVLKQAIPISRDRGGVTQLRELCCLMAVAQADGGHNEDACTWLERAELADPR